MNDVWIGILLPAMLLLGRVGAFLMVLPLFGWQALPMRVRAGMAMVLTMLLMVLTPPSVVAPGRTHLLTGVVLMAGEILCGVSLGLAVKLVFQAVEQGGRLAARQMGFAMGQSINPLSGEEGDEMGLFFEMAFSLFFLVLNGHHLLIALIFRSYDVFPVGGPPEAAVMCQALVDAGSTMLVFALRMAAPLLAAFVVVTVVLGVLARALPEMNILMVSFPIRIGLGFLMAAALTPYLNAFTYELADELGGILG